MIQSIGPPPTRHADRVVAEMLRELARKRAALAPAIFTALLSSTRDGGPRAQARMAERVREAGALGIELRTGTRGRYSLSYYEIVGWDPRRDAEIGGHDHIPDKPWLVIFHTYLKGRGRVVSSLPVLFVTHHVLSRAAQRAGLRTSEHILETATAIWSAITSSSMAETELFNPPPCGHRLVIADGTAVFLQRHYTREGALVATTVVEGVPSRLVVERVRTGRMNHEVSG